MTNYDYKKAETLEQKARNLIRKHRSRCLDDTPLGDCHYRALIRIKKLMTPYWNYKYDLRVSDQLERMYR